MDADAVILARVVGRAGHIVLNRPKALNALDLPMVQLMTKVLTAWRDDPAVELVIVTGGGDRAFCAGGDIRALRDAGAANDQAALHAFFSQEYALDLLTAEYPKPYIALIDGICMGGGIGVTVHGKYRVASEKAVFAMPETGIALFPDVGATYVLPRMHDSLGFYYGLTGARAQGADAVHAGFATDFVQSASFPALFDALCAEGITALPRFCAELPPFTLAQNLPAIARAFSAGSYVEILKCLEAQGDFGRATLEILAKMSPSSLLWSFAIMKAGVARSLKECFDAELRLTAYVCPHHDFLEGVRAMIIDKDRNPQWQPKTLADVDMTEIARIL
jgi:enoyl-CoA hydratase